MEATLRRALLRMEEGLPQGMVPEMEVRLHSLQSARTLFLSRKKGRVASASRGTKS